jgi:hypothetical protein
MLTPAIRAIFFCLQFRYARRGKTEYYTRLLRFVNASISTLALFVARVFADHTNDTVAADDLAVAADLLDRSPDFHFLVSI